MKRTRDGGIEQSGKNILEGRLSIESILPKVGERPGKQFAALSIVKPGATAQQHIKIADTFLTVLHEPSQEKENVYNVGNILFSRFLGNATAYENPQWLFDKEAVQFSRLVEEEFLLLVEGQKAGSEISSTVLLVGVILQIQYAILFAVPVSVEVLV